MIATKLFVKQNTESGLSRQGIVIENTITKKYIETSSEEFIELVLDLNRQDLLGEKKRELIGVTELLTQKIKQL